MKPIRDIHLQPTVHISSINLDTTTLKTGLSSSFKEIGPKADNENDVDVRAAAAMCQYAYYALNHGRKPKATLIDGWAPMTPSEIDKLLGSGFHLKLENKISGFNSMLFQKQSNGIRYFVYCTEGTEMTSVKDWFSNISQGLTGLSPQYTYSVQMAKRIDQIIGNNAVLWFIGHSLGGGLASNNSLATGRHAITFNAAGLHIYRVKATLLLNNRADLFHYTRRSNRIHAFVLKGEILNSVLRVIGQSAYGDVQQVICLYKDGETEPSAVQKHGLTTLLDCWRMQHD